MSLTKKQTDEAAERLRVAQATLNDALVNAGNCIMTEDEISGMEAALPRLITLAEELGVLAKPLNEWSRQEVMRFLALGVRAAVPLRIVGFALATDQHGEGHTF